MDTHDDDAIRNGSAGDDSHEPIHGVFSTMETKKVGTGTTQKKTKVKQYWLVQQINDERAEIQPINENLIPIGKKRVIDVDNLIDRFEPEPEFFVHNSFGPKQATNELDDGSSPAPESDSLAVDIEGFELTGTPEEMEKNARASFGLGLTYLKRGNLQKAEDIFDRLAGIEAGFVPKHKHMFNEFGISLRKENLFDTAIKHYLRANELSGQDDNLLHNIARAYYERNDIRNAAKYLERSLELNPDHTESRQFLAYIKKRHKSASGPIKMNF